MAQPRKPKRMSIEDMFAKPRRTKEVKVSEDATMLFGSIGAKQYDDLIAANPPTKEQAKDGMQWNPDTFAPAIIAACSVEPQITDEQALELWQSEHWSRGELMDIFIAVVRLNADGLDVPSTANA